MFLIILQTYSVVCVRWDLGEGQRSGNSRLRIRVFRVSAFLVLDLRMFPFRV